MNRFFSFCLLATPLFALAQQLAADVLHAEMRFAADAVQNGTRAAFLHHADSSGLVFERGKAVNAIEAWSKREDRPGILNWHPVYGWMAQSGDLGFTTGPWTFQPKTVNDSVVARGQFNTIWRKTANGEWKFLLDMGVGSTPDFAAASFHFPDKQISFTPGTLEEMLQAEKALVKNTKNAASLFKGYASAVSRHAFLLNRNGHLPATTTKEIATLINTMPPAIVYQQDGAGMAKSGDLGYVFGTTDINGKKDNYLRIWRREGKEWKLLLEVLPYECPSEQ